MDFEPGPVFARVRVPVLLFYETGYSTYTLRQASRR